MTTHRFQGTNAIVGLLFLGTILVLVLGLLACWQPIIAGHRRLGWWQGALLWIGDVTALFWFARFVFRHCVRREPLEDVPVQVTRSDGTRRAMFLSLGVAFLLDAAHTGHQLYEEWSARQRAVVTLGTVHSLRARPHGNRVSYRGEYSYRDAQGVEHQGVLLTGEEAGRFDNPLPDAVQQAMRANRIPFALDIDYDPEHPERNWPAQVGRLMDQAYLLLFSGFVLFAQLAVFAMFLGILYEREKHDGITPWWARLVEALPLLTEVGMLGIIALINLVDSV
jgi:hypothetical protein